MEGGSDGAGRSASAHVGAGWKALGSRDGEAILTAIGRLRLILSQLIEQLRMPLAPGQTYPYPRLRNFVTDVLAEGRRKHIAHVVLDADVGGVKEQLAESWRRGGEPASMTSYIAKSSLPLAIEEDKRMQAYRLGRSRIVVFDDIDSRVQRSNGSGKARRSRSFTFCGKHSGKPCMISIASCTGRQ